MPTLQRRTSLRRRHRFPTRIPLVQVETLEQRYLLATFTWDGGAAGNNWSEPANWVGDAGFPGAADIAVFTNNGAGVVNIDGAQAAAEVRFENSAGAGYTIIGDTLTIGGLSQMGDGANQIQARIDATGASGILLAGSLKLAHTDNVVDSGTKIIVNVGAELIVVGAATGSALGSAALDLAGGTLTVDPPPPVDLGGVTTGLVLWMDASDASTVIDDGTGLIERWEDKSGNNQHAFQDNPFARPTWAPAAMNGQPAIRFDGMDDGMFFPDTLNVVRPYTVIIVDQYYGNIQGRTLQSRDGNWLIGKHGGQNRYYAEGWVYQPNLAAGTFNPVIGTGVGTAPNLNQYYLNGQLVADTPGPAGNPLRMGLVGGGMFNEQSQADIAEVIIYDHALTSADRQAVESYLTVKYGLTSGGGGGEIADMSANDTTVSADSTIRMSSGVAGVTAGGLSIENGQTLTVDGNSTGQRFNATGAISVSGTATIDTQGGDLRLASNVQGATQINKLGPGALVAVAGATSVLDGITLNISDGELVIDGQPVPQPPLGNVTDGLAMWVDASDAATVIDDGTGAIQEWRDKSGNSFHATQPNSAARPTWNATAMNGQAAIRFDGVDDGMIFPDGLNISRPYTVIIVDQYYGSIQGRTLQSRDGNWLIGKHGGQNRYYAEGWVYQPDMPAGTFNPVIGTGVGNAPNLNQYYLNGQLVADTPGPTGNPQRFGLISGGQFNEQSQADVAEIVVYNRALTTQERKAVELYLGVKYGLPGFFGEANLTGMDLLVSERATVRLAPGVPSAVLGDVTVVNGATLSAAGDNSGQQLKIAGMVSIDGAANLGATTAELVVQGQIVGDADVNKVGTGRMRLESANPYTGRTNVLQGSLVVASDGALGTTDVGTNVLPRAELLLDGGIQYSQQETVELAGDGVGGTMGNLSGDNSFAGIVQVRTTSSVAIGMFTGADPGEGLDMQGDFLYATNILGSGGPQVGDALFTDDSAAGVSVVAQNAIIDWHAPSYGDTPDDDNLEFVMQSIRWSANPATVNTTLQNLTPGVDYKLQMLFTESCCDRGFDILVNGELIADDFNIQQTQGGINIQTAGAVVTYQFRATSDTLAIVFNGGTAPYPDHNPTFSAFTLEQNSGQVMGAAGVATLRSESGTLTLTNNVDLDTSSLRFDGAGGLTLANSIIAGGAAGLTKNGAGTVRLAAGNTYSGSTQINAGTLVVAANNALGDATNGTRVETGATLLFSGDVDYSTAEPITLSADNGGGIIGNLDGQNRFAGDISVKASGGGQITSFSGGDPGDGLDFEGDFLYAVNVLGPGGLQVGDASFTDDFAPGVFVSAQNAIINWHAPNYGDSINDDNLEIVMQSIRWSANPVTVNTALDGLTPGVGYKLQMLFTESCCDRGFDVTVNGQEIADDFNIQQTQGGINNTAAGAVITYEFIADSDQLLIVQNGGTAPYPDHNPTLSGFTLEQNTGFAGAAGIATISAATGSLALDGNLDLSQSTLIAAGAGQVLVNGAINGGVNASVTKSDSGSLVLANANVYGSGTLATAGSLVASNSSGSATGVGPVTIMAGAELGGNGAVSGAVTIAGSGTISPSPAAATLSTGDVTLQAGAIFEVQITADGPDAVRVIGMATIGDSNLVASLAGGFRPVDQQSFVILDNDGGDAVNGTFAGLPNGAMFELSDGVANRLFTIYYDYNSATNTPGTGNDVVLIHTNRQPEASSGGPYQIDEGAGVTLAGTGTDPDMDSLTYAWDLNGDGDFSDASGPSPTLSAAQLEAIDPALTDGPQAVTISLRVSDGEATADSSTTLTINNVAPTAGISGPSAGVPNFPVDFMFTASDPSLPDQVAGFTYSIGWGDGQSDVIGPGASSSETLQHGFANFGTFEVQVTVTDKDGGSSTTTLPVEITPVAQVGDDVLVGGSDSVNDRIIISDASRTSIFVRYNDVRFGPFVTSTASTVIVAGGDGNDRITVISCISTELHGDEGNDSLNGGPCGDVMYGDGGRDIILTGDGDNWADGGTGNDVISARDGNDELNGGDGNDKIIGGAGQDILRGHGGNDMIVGGRNDDLVSGGAGNDAVSGDSGNDLVLGGLGNDLIRGGDNDDLLIGGSGLDSMRGDGGADVVTGGEAENEDDDDALLAAWIDWTSMRDRTRLGQFLDDAERDGLNPGGNPDEVYYGPDDRLNEVRANDLLFAL